MLPQNVLILLLYPLASFVAPAAYFVLYPEDIRRLPSLPVSATDEERKGTLIRLGVNQPLMFYDLLSCCSILWLWFSQSSFHLDGSQFKGSVWGALRGGYVGLSWAGMWLWLWLVLSNPQRLSRAVPGYGARYLKQVVVCVVGAFFEELWRVLCIGALIASGYSPSLSVTAAAATFAIAFLGEGLERSILAGMEGALFGLLYVWQQSFFAPLAAHLAVQAVYLWGVGQFSPNGPRKPWMRAIRCPICNAQLSRLQIKIREQFNCPSCHERISVSDGYRNAMRWVGTLAYIFLYASTVLLLEHQISDTLMILVLWPVAFGVGTSGLLLYQRVFPPRLQYGSPSFITLNLDHHRPDASDGENKRH